MTQAVLEQTKRLQELVVYDLVSMDFVRDNIYKMSGTRPNAKAIASQYGCQLQIRKGEFESHRIHYFPNWLEDHGIDPKTLECMAAVLVGEDRTQLARARDDIHRTFGFTKDPDISVHVTQELIR
ncbi:MAG: hypothetical protein KKE50_02520 [Nanoarchaeota archaeon]|nr:hypothetical protein [Nanoarchaeota archaeon]